MKISAQGREVFHLQGRLGPRGWPATTTVALAFGVPGVYGYQVITCHAAADVAGHVIITRIDT